MATGCTCSFSRPGPEAGSSGSSSADDDANSDSAPAAPAVKLAFEFLVLTAARSGEVRLATWAEMDTERITGIRTTQTEEIGKKTPRQTVGWPI